jgi:2-polyprenyl-3-methyl-5-hydroxy-6-metoxy-1,4-benzoquinol methylase
MADTNYPDLEKFSKVIGISSDQLAEAFEIEKSFHKQILAEPSYEKRKNMYERVYPTVHAIYGKNAPDILLDTNQKEEVVRLFRKELTGQSVLDVGCGEGYFLASISRNLTHKELVGIDVSIPELSHLHPDIEFKTGDIVKFDLRRGFDVVFSDQVLEHIAPVDLHAHLQSVRSSLKPGGVFIINMPNRLFGPSDVTRIIDFSNTGKIDAQGTHLNESTYTELIPILEQNGFGKFRTVCPVPKLKYVFTNYRMQPSLLQIVESSPRILKVLHSIRLRGRCVAQFDVTLICNSLPG